MSLAWWVAALFSLCAWTGLTILFHGYFRRELALENIAPSTDENLPALAVIVPALNEQDTVRPAMRSLLASDYPELTVIAVDDRSTDGTGQILDELAAGTHRLTVFHVSELPAGWLGKNHALWIGASFARTPWMLFTDADVHFDPTALRRAVGFARDHNLDHLALLPQVVLRGFWETLFVSFFGVIFSARFRPWDVRNPKSSAYIGVGAFNLVRTDTYRRMGGHAALPLEVADDVKLGKLLKRGGARCDVIASRELVQVRWISGLGGAINGLTKNMFAGLEFRPERVAASCVMLFFFAVWPAVGAFAGPIEPRLICCAAWLMMAAAAAAPSLTMGISPLIGLGYPVAGVLILYTMLKSMWITYRQGGVVWRGTLYPLSELRKGVV